MSPRKLAFCIFCLLIISLFILISPISAAPVAPPFHTNSTTAGFSFVSVGDWGCTQNTISTLKNIIARKPSLVLGLGDFSYGTTADCWLNMTNNILNKTRITLGNHDVPIFKKLIQYINYFHLRAPFSSFDNHNLHFLSMASEFALENGSDQYRFVSKDLAYAASNPNIRWIIVIYHRPAYTSPSVHSADIALRDLYHPLFEKYHVDLVLQGHNHAYERSYPIEYNSMSPLNPIMTSKNTNNYTNPQG